MGYKEVCEDILEQWGSSKRNSEEWMTWIKEQSHMFGKTVTFELAPRYKPIDQSLLPEHNKG